MGEEGFSSDSSLLYHRGDPVGDRRRARRGSCPTSRTTPNEPLLPRHLRLHDLFPGEELARRPTPVTGRRLVLGNADVRISYVVAGADRRRSTATRSATSASTSRPARRRSRRCSARSRSARATTSILPRATTHRWVPDRRRAAARVLHRGEQPHRAAASATCRGSASCSSTRRTASATCAGPTEPLLRDGHRRRGLRQAPRRRARAAWPAPCTSTPRAPVRRRRLGRLPLPVRVQRRRLRADHRPRAPAAAGAPGLRGQQLRHLQLRAAQGRLPPAVDPGALLPLERRLRRGHVLRDGDYEARKGSGIGKGSISLHPGGHSHGPQPGAVERSLGAEYFDELAVMVDTFRPLELGEARHGVRRRRVRLVVVGPGPLGVTWLDLPDGHRLRPATTCPTASSRRPAAAPAHRRARSATRCSTCAARHRATPCTPTGSLNALHGPRAARRGPSCAPSCTDWLTDDAAPRARRAAPRAASTRSTLHLPFEVADYVDFYASEQHAANVGRIFRPGRRAAAAELEAPADRLPRPRRHGRRSRARRSRRPCGQRRGPTAPPTFGPSTAARLRGRGRASSSARRSTLGEPVPLGDFAEHVFGVCLVNDWSARDIQAWEYVPLGPFLGKSFATSISPWVVPLAALERGPRPRRRPATRSRCPTCATTATPWGLDITLEVRLNGQTVSRPAVRRTCTGPPAQQLAHLTVNGATPAHRRPLRAPAPSAGRERDQRGSLLELSWGGARAADAGRRLDPHVPRGRRRGHRSPPPRPGRTAPGSASAR